MIKYTEFTVDSGVYADRTETETHIYSVAKININVLLTWSVYNVHV